MCERTSVFCILAFRAGPLLKFIEVCVEMRFPGLYINRQGGGKAYCSVLSRDACTAATVTSGAATPITATVISSQPSAE